MDEFKVSAAYELNENVSKEEFLRKVLLELATDKDTPRDILTGDFSSVRCEKKDFLFTTVETEIDYSCLAGVDREEEYWDKRQYMDHGVKKTEDVKRKRTVTDWFPTNGTNKGTYTEFVGNCEQQDRYENERNAYALQHTPDSCIKECDFNQQVCPDAIDSAKSLAAVHCWLEVAPPKHKEEKYNAVQTVDDAVLYSIPQYTVNYTYNNRKIKVTAPAVGEKGKPFLAFSDKTFEDNEKENKLKKRKLPFMISGGVSIFLSVLFMIIAGVMEGIDKDSTVWNVLWALFLVIGIAVFVVMFVIAKRWSNDMDRQIAQIKKENLQKLFSEKHYAPLTKEEEAMFAVSE